MFFDVFVFCFDSAFTHVCIHLFVFPPSDYENNYKVTWGGWMISWSGESQCGKFACVYIMKIVQM